ncbi:hypothetical protein DFH06DRAFT_1135969 [Mycena polygramma]|nr:hypothetical protein DFH06DRAFT_1135969 [Mycena polygramma]
MCASDAITACGGDASGRRHYELVPSIEHRSVRSGTADGRKSGLDGPVAVTKPPFAAAPERHDRAGFEQKGESHLEVHRWRSDVEQQRDVERGCGAAHSRLQNVREVVCSCSNATFVYALQIVREPSRAACERHAESRPLKRLARGLCVVGIEEGRSGERARQRWWSGRRSGSNAPIEARSRVVKHTHTNARRIRQGAATEAFSRDYLRTHENSA